MLAVRPSPVPLWPKELPRGRSRQISPIALARLASQERRTSKPVTTNTTIATPHTDYYDSPPSPPRSLEDQVHVAYAHDDIHLAKILLLRLKGIHVTGNDDPRIAEVKDEDFDFCFVPYGRLLDEEEEKMLKERQHAELARAEELRRTQRLKDCERIWEQGKKRLRELKKLAVRRRELEEKRRAELEDPRLRYGADFESRVPRRVPYHAPRTVVSYKLVTSSVPHKQDPFVYDFMPQPPIHPVSRPQTLSHLKSKSPFARPLFDDSRAVHFTEVLTSMQGPLFPPEKRSNATPLSTSRSQDSQKRRSAELLESLLLAVDNEEEHRRQKGKAPERPMPRRKDSGGMLISPCPTCSSSSLLSSGSSSSSSSRRSWLSFSSASSSSASTAVTTPSSSPPSTLLSKPTPTSLRKTTWFLAPRPSSNALRSTPPLASTVLHPCKCSTSHLTPVSPLDAPLPVLPDATCSTFRLNTAPTPAVYSNNTATAPSTSLIVRRFTQFIDLAKGFQLAYMSAAMFVVPPVSETRAAASLCLHVSSRASSSSKPYGFPALNPPGARTRPVDVRVFLGIPGQSTNEQHTLRPIPLRALDAGEDDDLDFTRTSLPSPLPYELRFKPHPVPPRSPFRAVHGVAPPGNVVLRLRNVENPVYLRVKAAENETRGLPVSSGFGAGAAGARFGFGFGRRAGVGYAAGLGGVYHFGVGVGRPVPIEGSLACGREKMLRVAYEGIGGSRLKFEMKEGGLAERDVCMSGVTATVVEVGGRGRGRGRARTRARDRLLERGGDGEDEDEEWTRGGRRNEMLW